MSLKLDSLDYFNKPEKMNRILLLKTLWWHIVTT